jgi:hypothetical protein
LKIGPVGPRLLQGTASAVEEASASSELPVLLKKLFQVIVIGCGL